MAFFTKPSPRREQAADKLDREANRVANAIARERKAKVARRKWAIETACLCADEMTAAGRIELARAIDAYVHEGEA